MAVLILNLKKNKKINDLLSLMNAIFARYVVLNATEMLTLRLVLRFEFSVCVIVRFQTPLRVLTH